MSGWIREAVDDIPEAIRLKIANVAFILEDRERPARSGEYPILKNQILLGLYHGVPLPRRAGNYNMVPPDTITIFKAAIEQVAGPDPVRIKEQARATVWHEIAHYLGMNEDEVRGWERQRKNRGLRLDADGR
jgi:predicted Zn-dependent protease with MMP-like domain